MHRDGESNRSGEEGGELHLDVSWDWCERGGIGVGRARKCECVDAMDVRVVKMRS